MIFIEITIGQQYVGAISNSTKEVLIMSKIAKRHGPIEPRR